LALSSPKNGGCSVCIVRSWTQATVFVSLLFLFNILLSSGNTVTTRRVEGFVNTRL
jgi:hypothetical protein